MNEHEFKVRILMLGVLGFLLSIKSDRYYPFPESLPEPVYQLLLLPLTVIVLIAIFCFLKPAYFHNSFSFLNRISVVRLTVLICLIFQVMVLVLLFMQDIRYSAFGYDLIIPIAVLIVAATCFIFIYIFFRERASNLLFPTAIASYTGTFLLSIVSFPLHPARSDMLPLIVSGCSSVLSGIIPYGYHNIPEHLVFTYLPGMWIPYLPAVATGIDPRIITLVCVISGLIILAISMRKGRENTILLLPVFCLTPYLTYRHDIYLGVLFLVLSIVYVLNQRHSWLSCGAVFGYALATYQFSWVLFPFFIVSVFRRSGIYKALIATGAGIGVALLIILPFFLSSPDMFLLGIYGHWDYFFVPNINLAYFVSFLIPWRFLIVLQGIIMIILLISAMRMMDPDDMWGWMAGALFLFIALNRNIEIYFYLLVVFLLVLHGIAVSVNNSAQQNLTHDSED